jgi:metal-responsive CopG/Arc/MetJ family transcriptional regulator
MTRRGNPPDSKWYSAPNEARHRIAVHVTLPRDLVKRVDKARKERSRSEVVESALEMWLKA